MEIGPQQSIPGLALGAAMLPSPGREVQQGTVKDAAVDFVGYLFAQVFSQMRPDPSDQEEGGLFSGEQSGMFMDFFDQAIGKQFAAHGGDRLVESMVGQLDPAKKKATPTRPTAP
jgi:Rod binding domain-containing protein